MSKDTVQHDQAMVQWSTIIGPDLSKHCALIGWVMPAFIKYRKHHNPNQLEQVSRAIPANKSTPWSPDYIIGIFVGTLPGTHIYIFGDN